MVGQLIKSPVTIERVESDVIRIEGIAYSGDFFRTLSEEGVAVGTVLRLVKRVDGAISFERVDSEAVN